MKKSGQREWVTEWVVCWARKCAWLDGWLDGWMVGWLDGWRCWLAFVRLRASLVACLIGR